MPQPTMWLSPVPHAMPTNPNAGIGPKPNASAHASGTFRTATERSVFRPVRVSPAPIRHAMPPASTM